MTESRKSDAAGLSHWTTVTGPNAVCGNCEMAIYGRQSESPGPEARRIYRWAREHARRTGHRVRIDRGQLAFMGGEQQ